MKVHHQQRCVQAAIVGLLAVTTVPVARAADAFSVFEHHPAERIRSLAQTNDGFLWIGSDEGLLRYDGKVFIPATRTADLRQPITALHRLPDGTLLAATPWPPAVFVRKPLGLAGGEWLRLPQAPPTEIVAFASQGSLTWILTDSDLYTLENDRLEKHPVPAAARGLTTLAVSPRGTLWLAGQSGVWQRPTGTALPQRVYPHPTKALHVDKEGGLLIGTESEGLWRLPPTINATPVLLQKEGLDPSVLSIASDDQDGAWVGTGNGLFSASANNLQPAIAVERLPSTRILSVLSDGARNVWLGTDGGGLVELRRQTLFHLAPVPPKGSAFSFTLTPTADGSVWGTQDGFRLLRWQGSEVAAFEPPEATAGWDYRSMVADDQGVVWFAGIGSGLHSFDPHTQNFAQFNASDGLSDPGIHALFRTRDGVLWLAPNRGGLIEKRGKVFVSHPQTEFECLSVVTSMVESPQGDIYIATDGDGLCVRRNNTGRFVRVHTTPDLPTQSLLSLSWGSANTLWLGSRNAGLLRVKDGNVARLSFAEGLETDHIPEVLFDPRGHLWLPTRLGILRIAEADANAVADKKSARLSPFRLSTADGLPSNECAWGWPHSAVQNSQGAVWVATRGGVVIIDQPADLALPALPDFVFDEVTLDGKPFALSDSLSHPPRVDEGVLAIRYTVPLLSHRHRVQIRYRLEGQSSTWSGEANQGHASFGNLNAGAYTFRVQASYQGLLRPMREAQLHFRLAPPLHRTPLVWSLLGTLLLGLLFWGMRVRLFKRRLQSVAVAAERGRIARDIHDTLEQTFVAIRFQAAAAQRSLSHPDTAQRNLLQVMSLVEQGVSETRAVIWSLRSNESSPGLVQALSSLASVALRGTSLAFKIEASGSANFALGAEREIQILRILREAIANVLKHAEATELTMRLHASAAELNISLSDNGRGFDASRPPPSGHFGLENMKVRGDAIGAKLTFAPNPNGGTIVTLAIPLAFERKT